MFKLLAGAAIGFAAAWFMDSTEGEHRRTMLKERASGLAGKGKQGAQSAAQSAQGVAEQVKEKATSDNGETVSSGSQVS